MNKTTLGRTTLEYIPEEFLHPKRATNRTWTLVGILLITILFAAYALYRQHIIADQAPTVVPVVPPPPATELSMNELETLVVQTEIPSFHETL